MMPRLIRMLQVPLMELGFIIVYVMPQVVGLYLFARLFNV